MADLASIRQLDMVIEVMEVGTQGPPGVVFLAAMPFIDTTGATHEIRIDSDAMIPFFDSLGDYAPIHLTTTPA